MTTVLHVHRMPATMFGRLLLTALLLKLCTYPTLGESWDAIVYTGDESFAATGAKIEIEIYGTEGYNGRTTLRGDFVRDTTDTTTFWASIGEPYTITVYSDGAGVASGWYLGWIKLKSRATHNAYRFACYCWLDGESKTISGDTEVCTNIPHCRPGHKVCRKSIEDSSCSLCDDPYYSGGWRGGCRLCPSISKCTDRNCSSSSDVKCRSCQHNNVLSKVSSDGRQCDDLCAWNNHYCWPGTCGNGLVKNCRCASGFQLTSTSTETTCQLKSSPSFETCATRTLVPNGEMKMSETKGPTTACQYQNDYYGNFIPEQHHFNVLARYSIDTSAFPPKASYIESSNFGITDLKVDSVIKRLGAQERILQTLPVLTDTTLSKNANETFAEERSLNLTNITLQSGDRYVDQLKSTMSSFDISMINRC